MTALHPLNVIHERHRELLAVDKKHWRCSPTEVSDR